jgi:hypothetical protein
LVVILLVSNVFQLAISALLNSFTLNEPGHLVSGLAHWKYCRFEPFCVNPPLVRCIAALPILMVGSKEDWSGFHNRPGLRVETAIGTDYVSANSERSFSLLRLARWACVPFNALGAIVCFRWAKELGGQVSGLLAATL